MAAAEANSFSLNDVIAFPRDS